jgi:hypothetical protein
VVDPRVNLVRPKLALATERRLLRKFELEDTKGVVKD